MSQREIVQIDNMLFVVPSLGKGGPGSGNFGHAGGAGGPGNPGGSGGGLGGGGSKTSVERILQSKNTFASLAQKVYDDWAQDDEGYDEELGSGGICQDIAGEISGKLNEMGYDATTVSAQVGEQHVWTVVKADEGTYEVDIPPGVYESGGGYTWSKKPGVEFTAGDVIINRLGDTEDFEQYTEDM